MSLSKAKNFKLQMGEWNKVHDGLYKSETRAEKEEALHTISIWRVRFQRVPTGLDVTDRIARALLLVEDAKMDAMQGFAPSSSSHISNLHNILGLAIVRFVNLITDLNQKGLMHRSIHQAAKDFNIPQWIVELRHDCAHSGMPSIYRLVAAARWCFQWLGDRYWAEEQPALKAKLSILRAREGMTLDSEDDKSDSDDDAVQEVNPHEELIDSYLGIINGRMKSGINLGETSAEFDRIIDSLTMAVSQNADDFMDVLLRPGYFYPTRKQALVNDNVEFKRWLPLLEAVYNASMYSLPLLLETLLHCRYEPRPAFADKAAAQWTMFIIRNVAKCRLKLLVNEHSDSEEEDEIVELDEEEEPEEVESEAKKKKKKDDEKEAEVEKEKEAEEKKEGEKEKKNEEDKEKGEEKKDDEDEDKEKEKEKEEEEKDRNDDDEDKDEEKEKEEEGKVRNDEAKEKEEEKKPEEESSEVVVELQDKPDEDTKKAEEERLKRKRKADERRAKEKKLRETIRQRRENEKKEEEKKYPHPPPEEAKELNMPPHGICEIVTIDHDLPVNWPWVLQMAVRNPHKYTKYLLPVLGYLSCTPKEKVESMVKMVDTYVGTLGDGEEEAGGGDERMDVSEDAAGGAGGDEDDLGWELCSDKLPWKQYPLGNVPGKDLCSKSLKINWEMAD